MITIKETFKEFSSQCPLRTKISGRCKDSDRRIKGRFKYALCSNKGCPRLPGKSPMLLPEEKKSIAQSVQELTRIKRLAHEIDSKMTMAVEPIFTRLYDLKSKRGIRQILSMLPKDTIMYQVVSRELEQLD